LIRSSVSLAKRTAYKDEHASPAFLATNASRHASGFIAGVTGCSRSNFRRCLG